MTVDASAPRPSIGCVVPACNEQGSIARVIESLLAQTRVPDLIHVVVGGTSDATVEIASRYAGPHEPVTALGAQFTEVFVHDIGSNPAQRIGALNYGYTLVEACDYLLGAVGDTAAEAHAVEHLEARTASDPRIVAISGEPSADGTTAFTLRRLFRGPSMDALARPFSIVSTQALRDVMRLSHRPTPWVTGMPHQHGWASVDRHGVQASSDVRR